MGAIYHKGSPYSGQMVVDTDLSAASNNPLKNRAITGLVDDVIAPVEGANASQAYSAGDELILNNLLYKAKSAITQDTPFDAESGGNIELAGSIAEQLKALFANEDLLKRSLGENLTNCNSVADNPGLRFYTYSGSALNKPGAATYGWGFLIDTCTSANDHIQIGIDKGTLAIYVRAKTSGGWDTAWKQIYGAASVTTIAKSSWSINATSQSETLFTVSKGVYLLSINAWNSPSCYMRVYVNGTQADQQTMNFYTGDPGGFSTCIITCPNDSNTVTLYNPHSAKKEGLQARFQISRIGYL